VSVSTSDDELVRWEMWDAAVARLRECRSAADIARSLGPLALEGCGADAASFGVVSAGVWSEWCRAGRTELLDEVARDPLLTASPAGDPEAVAAVGGTDGLRHQDQSGGRRRVVVSIPASIPASTPASAPATEQVRWLLQVMTSTDIDLELVASFAAALASMLALVAVRQGADQQRYVVARLINGLDDHAEPTVELVDPGSPSGPPRAGAASGPGVAPPVRARLSPRQREVMELMLRGLSNAEIAERLVVALPTVKSHVRAVLRASGAVNRSDAIARLARDDPTP
jgi:DNA-binding CsgD family transcriptional regulator